MTLDGEHRSPPGKDVGAAVPGEGSGEGGALRVVAFFDALLDAEVDAAGLVRRAASYAGCPVGIRTVAGRMISAGPSGSRGPATIPPGAARQPLRRGDEVWLHRSADPHPLDGVVLHRLGVAAGVALERAAAAADRSALLEQALSDRTPEVDRASCLRGLRLTPAASVRGFVLAGPPEGHGELVDQVRAVSPTVHAASVSEVTAVLAQEPAVPDRWDVPVGTHLAWSRPCPAVEAPAAWREARTALRFTLPGTHAHGPYTDQEAVVTPAEQVGAFLAPPNTCAPRTSPASPTSGPSTGSRATREPTPSRSLKLSPRPSRSVGPPRWCTCTTTPCGATPQVRSFRSHGVDP